VELVGRVVSVKEGRTKYGKPYAFVNFSDWRADGIKLIYWSEGLEAVGSSAPDDSWVGRWLSATGLVDEPYENLRFGTTQYSVTILSGSQVRLLDEAEAKRRLDSASGAVLTDASEGAYDDPDIEAAFGVVEDLAYASPASAPRESPSTNAAFMADRFGTVYAAESRGGVRSPDPAAEPRPSRAGASVSPARPSNAELLAELSGGPKAAGPASAAGAAAPRQAAPGVSSPASRPAPASPAKAPAREGLPAGCAWAILIGIAFFFFWALGQ